MEAYRDNIWPKCMICHETPALGIMGGVLVRHRFICDDCQDKLLSASAGELFYDQSSQAFKTLWGFGGRLHLDSLSGQELER